MASWGPRPKPPSSPECLQRVTTTPLAPLTKDWICRGNACLGVLKSPKAFLSLSIKVLSKATFSLPFLLLEHRDSCSGSRSLQGSHFSLEPMSLLTRRDFWEDTRRRWNGFHLPEYFLGCEQWTVDCGDLDWAHLTTKRRFARK